jgi:hypothetical protein
VKPAEDMQGSGASQCSGRRGRARVAGLLFGRVQLLKSVLEVESLPEIGILGLGGNDVVVARRCALLKEVPPRSPAKVPDTSVHWMITAGSAAASVCYTSPPFEVFGKRNSGNAGLFSVRLHRATLEKEKQCIS